MDFNAGFRQLVFFKAGLRGTCARAAGFGLNIEGSVQKKEVDLPSFSSCSCRYAFDGTDEKS